ncbi:MAG: hypothetical protein Q9178_006567 [Gyalolechia marmorata]
MLATTKPPIFSPNRRLTTSRSTSYDVPNTLVRISLQKFTGYELPPANIPAFIHTAVIALDRTAAHAGGPTAHLEPDRKLIGYANYGLAMNFFDVTVSNPEVAGGRLRFDEVKAVYQGIGAVIHQIGYEECTVEAWRLVSGRDGKKVRVKVLMSGYFLNSHNAAKVAVGLESGEIAGNETATS